jgi:hypothetical protein
MWHMPSESSRQALRSRPCRISTAQAGGILRPVFEQSFLIPAIITGLNDFQNFKSINDLKLLNFSVSQQLCPPAREGFLAPGHPVGRTQPAAIGSEYERNR